MTDVEHPKMAGSGDRDPGAESRPVAVPVENSEINSNTENVGPGVNNTKRHKRAHSRNKSISGRQDFLEEIANSEFKQLDPDTHQSHIEDQKDEVSKNETGSIKEKEKLLPEGSDVPDGLHINPKHNGGHGQ